MNIKGLVRNPEMVHSTLKELDNDTVVTTKGCKIYIPARFGERKLAILGHETYIVAIFAMVVDDRYYAVSIEPAMMRIDPTTVNTINLDGENYYEFTFDPGSTVIANTNLVKKDTLTYDIFQEIVSKGRVPWYISYEDLATLYDGAPKHAGVTIGANHAIIEMILSVIARDPSDATKYYRQALKDAKGPIKPLYVPFSSVTHGATNTTAKLMGAYWKEGLNSALVNPTDKVERVEELLRR